jgi:DNA primase
MPTRPAAASGTLARPPRHDLDATRRERLLLELLVTHPFIVAEHAEEVVGLHFGNGLYGRARDCLLELVASEPDADRARAAAALEAAGLEQLLRRAGPPAAKFASAEATPEEALAGFRQVSELHRRGGSLKAEKEAAEAAFAEDPSEANWLRLRQLVEILEDGIASDPDLPDRAL